MGSVGSFGRGADVVDDDLGLAAARARTFEVGGGGITEREHSGLSLDLKRRCHLDRSVSPPGVGEGRRFEVVADGLSP